MKHLSLEEKITLQTYEDFGQKWIDTHLAIDYYGDEIAIFNQYLPAGKILEIGFGGGRDAKEFVKLGYDYVGIDISPNFVQIAQKAVPEGTFYEKSVYDLDFPKDSFDGFWAAASLLHIPKNNIDDVLKSLKDVVKDGGIGFISLKEGIGEGMEPDSFNENKTERFFSKYTAEEFNQVLAKNNITVLKMYEKVNKKGKNWLHYFVKV